MTKYEEIIAHLKDVNPAAAEIMEDEVDIIIHKLKFLPKDNFPIVTILEEENDFQPIYNSLLVEKVSIAGGVLSNTLNDNPQVIIIMQQSDNLYTVLPPFLSNLKTQKIRALIENKVFIIQHESLSDNDEKYTNDLEILSEILQPKYFVYGHDGEEWVKFDLL